MEPYPTFLGIKLDPKICFKPHLEQLERNLVPKINILRRIKNFKWANSLKINIILYKSLIRSLFDYCVVILNVGTEKIKNKLQIIQNKILKIIKYFPIKTPIRTIHKVLKLDTIEQRANNLFVKFLQSKTKQDIIAYEIQQFTQNHQANKRFKTPLDNFFELSNPQPNHPPSTQS